MQLLRDKNERPSACDSQAPQSPGSWWLFYDCRVKRAIESLSHRTPPASGITHDTSEPSRKFCKTGTSIVPGVPGGPWGADDVPRLRRERRRSHDRHNHRAFVRNSVPGFAQARATARWHSRPGVLGPQPRHPALLPPQNSLGIRHSNGSRIPTCIRIIRKLLPVSSGELEAGFHNRWRLIGGLESVREGESEHGSRQVWKAPC